MKTRAELREELRQLSADLRRIKVEFIITEIELGLTFASRALETKIESTRRRNYFNAQKAYTVAVRGVKDVAPEGGQRRKIEAGLRRLMAELKQLSASVRKQFDGLQSLTKQDVVSSHEDFPAAECSHERNRQINFERYELTLGGSGDYRTGKIFREPGRHAASHLQVSTETFRDPD